MIDTNPRSVAPSVRALDTTSIPSGAAGNQNIIETFSSMIGTRVYDNALLSKVTRVPATSAYRMRRISTVNGMPNEPTVAVYEQGAAQTFSDFAYAETRTNLATLRVGVEISNELLADSAVQQQVASMLAEQLQERMCLTIATAVGAQMDQTRHNRSAVTGGTANAAALLGIIYGYDTAAGGMLAGQPFASSELADLCIIANGTNLQRLAVANQFTSTYTQDELVDFRVMQGQAAYPSIFGVPVCALRSWILPTVANTTPFLLPHFLCVNTRKIVLAEQSVVVSVDSESMAAENETRIVASVRCAAFLESTMAATALTIRSS